MRTSDMKKFVLKVTLFALCIVLVDCLCGIFFPILQSHAKGGSTRTNYYISDKCNADILVLGSSRAMRHYVPQILDSLGGLAYNAGNDGYGIILGLGRYLLCAEQHVPKIVILDITAYDYQNDDNSRYLGLLRPNGDRDFIKGIITQIGEPYAELKLLSNMYRHSSRVIPYIRDFFANQDFDNRGYSPRFGSCENCGKAYPRNGPVKLDSVKLNIFDQFVKETAKRGSELYFTLSPRFSEKETTRLPTDVAYAEELSKKYNIPLLNNIFISGISNDPSLFTDRTHLNNKGAILYTHKVLNDLSVMREEGDNISLKQSTP